MGNLPRRRLTAKAWHERVLVHRAAALFRVGWLRSEIAQALGLTPLQAGALVRLAERLGMVESANVVRARPARRPCLTCSATFAPTHRHNRLCPSCSGHAAGLPAGWA